MILFPNYQDVKYGWKIKLDMKKETDSKDILREGRRIRTKFSLKNSIQESYENCWSSCPHSMCNINNRCQRISFISTVVTVDDDLNNKLHLTVDLPVI